MSTVQILYFDGCPNHAATVAMVEQVVADVDPGSTIDVIKVSREEEICQVRFLGSPTVRVNGVDVEPGADQRTDYVMACRVYRRGDGISGQPDIEWVRAALASAIE